MKILYITNNFPNKQLPIFGIFVKEQIDSIVSLGVKADVYFINAKLNGKFEYLRSALALRKMLMKNQYDIIHCHHSFSGLTLLLSGRINLSKTILSYQADPFNEGGLLLFKILSKFFNKIIFKNNSVLLRYKQTCSIPNGVNLNFFKPLDQNNCKKYLSLDSLKTYILFVSSNFIRKEKRLDRFLSVIDILKMKLPEMNITPLILSNTERHQIPYYICASSLHLLTSDFEGSPNSVKECLSCNIPIVSTPVGNVREMLENIEGCYVSNSFDEEELAYLAVKALRYGRIEGRKALFEKGLTQEYVAIKLIDIYKKTLESKKIK